jgi:uncharacterized protein YkwD
LSHTHRILIAAACVASLLGGVAHPADAKSKGEKPAAAVSPGGSARQIVSLTNQARARNGLPALRIDGRCSAAISSHVADMAARGFLSHQGSDGRGPDQRYRKHNPGSLGAGENLAYNGSGSAQAFMQQWLNSSVHRGNILNRKYKGIGVAVRGTCSGKGKERRCAYYAGQCFSL